VTSLHPRVFILVCLLGPTTYRKSLPALTLRVLCHVLLQKGSSLIAVEDVNHDNLPRSMATTRMETTRGPAYSVCRAIEVTAWQSVDAICLCCLTHGRVRSLDSEFLLAISMGATGSACPEKWHSFHLSMPSPRDLQRVLDQPVCSML